MNKGLWFMLGSIVASAAMYVFYDYLFRHYSIFTPENSSVWGAWGAVILSTPIFLRSSESRQRLKHCFQSTKWLMIFIAAITSLGAFLWHYSLSRSNSGVSTLVSQSEVIFAFILGIVFLREKITFREILALLVAVSGIVVISNLDGEISLFVIGMLLVSRFMYAFQSFMIKKYTDKSLDSFSFGYLRTIFMAVFLALFFGLQGKVILLPLPLIFMAGLGIFLNAIISKSLFFEAHKYLPISKLNLFKFLQPALVLTVSFFFFHDPISSQKILGSVLTVGGLLWFTREQMKLKKKKF